MEDTTIKFWIARDKNGHIGLYRYKPIWRVSKATGIEDWHDGVFTMFFNPGEFSEVTFENSPQEVELKLVK